MRKLFIVVLGVSCFATAYPQQLPPPFSSLRWKENYAHLEEVEKRSAYERVKYLPLGKQQNSYLSFGGDIRYQYFKSRNEAWGEEPQDKDGYLLNRFLAHAHLHAGSRIRAFVQLQSSLASSKELTSAVDENALELHQAFVEVGIAEKEAHTLNLRVGRQELSYGSQRLISVRERPNNRQSFDGVTLLYHRKDLAADFFYTRYVSAQKRIFDDKSSRGVQLWGAYVSWKNKPVVNVDLYYLGLWKRTAAFDEGTGEELRHSIGTRLWGEDGNGRYDIELVWQRGRFNGGPISAWTASVHTLYRFSQLWLQPTLGLKAELISGDTQPNDGRLGTFNPLFPKGAYFGYAALIGPSNLMDVHPYLNFSLTSKLEWNLDYDVFWRYSNLDGLYATNVSLIYSGRSARNKFIGHQISSDLSYRPNRHLEISCEGTWFKSGSFLKKVGPGKNILLGGVTLQVTF